MKDSAKLIVALLSLMVAGCASNEPNPVLSQYLEAHAQGPRAKYYEEIRAPASAGLLRGVECNVR